MNMIDEKREAAYAEPARAPFSSMNAPGSPESRLDAIERAIGEAMDGMREAEARLNAFADKLIGVMPQSAEATTCASLANEPIMAGKLDQIGSMARKLTHRSSDVLIAIGRLDEVV